MRTPPRIRTVDEDAQRDPILKLQAELREARSEAAILKARGDALFVALEDLRDNAERFAGVLAEYIANNGDWVHEDKDGYENTECPQDASCTCPSLVAVNEAEAKYNDARERSGDVLHACRQLVIKERRS
jgi:hypothetical protein